MSKHKKWCQNRHPDVMHHIYNPSCKTTLPSPGRVHGNSGWVCKKAAFSLQIVRWFLSEIFHFRPCSIGSVQNTWWHHIPFFSASRCTNPCISINAIIIPTPNNYAYFKQFDWLEKMFYILINSLSRNLGTIFLPPTPNLYKHVSKNKILITKLELHVYGMNVSDSHGLHNQ